jgi:hypothetical protein
MTNGRRGDTMQAPLGNTIVLGLALTVHSGFALVAEA